MSTHDDMKQRYVAWLDGDDTDGSDEDAAGRAEPAAALRRDPELRAALRQDLAVHRHLVAVVGAEQPSAVAERVHRIVADSNRLRACDAAFASDETVARPHLSFPQRMLPQAARRAPLVAVPDRRRHGAQRWCFLCRHRSATGGHYRRPGAAECHHGSRLTARTSCGSPSLGGTVQAGASRDDFQAVTGGL